MWRRLAWLWVPALALVLVGCRTTGDGATSPTPAAGPAAGAVPTVAEGAPLTLIKLIVPQGASFDVALPVFVAEQEDYFARYGVQVETQTAKGGADTVQAVATGDADAALGTGPLAVFGAFAQGARLAIVSSQMIGSPDLVFYAPAASPISGPEDFPGHKIGYSEPGSSSHFALLALRERLRQQGLGDFDMVPVGAVADGLAAVQSGRVDAGWAGVPFAPDGLADRQLKVVARGADLPALRDVSLRVDVVDADFAAEHPGAIKGMLAALRQAYDFIYDPNTRDQAMTIWKQRTSLRQSPTELASAYDYIPKAAVAVGPMKGADVANQMAVQGNLLKAPLTQQELDEVITSRYLPGT
jgi:NitT/TauT family transport system substrate-binding protein